MGLPSTRIQLSNTSFCHLFKGWAQDGTQDGTHHDGVGSSLLRQLLDEVPFRETTIQMFGRQTRVPRLTSYHGDSGASYRYSQTTFEPLRWTTGLSVLRDKLASVVLDGVPLRFNSVLCNYYRDGSDSMGFHSDDEPELGPDSPSDVLIASVSFGAPRDFVIRAKTPKKEVIRFQLGDGDLLVMTGAMQNEFEHALPKRKRVLEPRINLTFRQIVSSRSR